MNWLKVLLLAVLVLGEPTSDARGCDASDATQTIKALHDGIDLNERFKRAARSRADAIYEDLRKKVEHHAETIGMPCIRRAVVLLDQQPNEMLLRTMMLFAVSYENSSDETVSDAIASAFVKSPDAVRLQVETFSPKHGSIILRRLESGWLGVRRDLPDDTRRDLEARLRELRAFQNSSASFK